MTAPALVGPVHWRKNPLIAATMVPLVLTLADGRFTAFGPDGVPVWDAAAQDVTGSLGKMGTFKITVGGRKFALVGRGSAGGTEKGHSPAQVEVVRQFLARHPGSAPAASDAGLVDAVLNGSAAARMDQWRQALSASGAQVR